MSFSVIMCCLSYHLLYILYLPKVFLHYAALEHVSQFRATSGYWVFICLLFGQKIIFSIQHSKSFQNIRAIMRWTRFGFSQMALWFENRVFHFTNVFLICNNVFLGTKIYKSFMLRRSFSFATMSFNMQIIAFDFNRYTNYIHVYITSTYKKQKRDSSRNILIIL